MSHLLDIHKTIEREQRRYMVMNGRGCNMSNNLDLKDLEDLFNSSL